MMFKFFLQLETLMVLDLSSLDKIFSICVDIEVKGDEVKKVTRPN